MTRMSLARGAVAAAAAVVVFFVMTMTRQEDPPQQDSAVLTSGGESAGTGDTEDKAAVVAALLQLLDGLGLQPEDLVECAKESGSGKDGAESSGDSAGCAPAEDGDPVDEATITIANFAFGAELTVAPGATVTVVNEDKAQHNVTSSRAGSFATENLKAGESVTFTAPKTPGRYTFTCTIHPEMTGALVVDEPGSGGSGGSGGGSTTSPEPSPEPQRDRDRSTPGGY